jgi:cytochrome oxidase Cu insertion factor (SCO1/SenC/PrrC family)
MPGMENGPNITDPKVVAAFHAALVHQGLVVALLLAAVGVAWNLLRNAALRQAAPGTHDGIAAARAGAGRHTAAGSGAGVASDAEPPARRLLRVALGLLWLFDGVLQAQASMPLGLVPDVVHPAAQGAPAWVQHVVAVGSGIWSAHPVTAAAAVVWIQVGIGLWLLVAPQGTASRLAAVVSAEWAVVVWVFGEAFGSIFSPGPSWLFGIPGSVLLYAAGAVLLVLPESAWRADRLGRALARVLGAFLLGMAVLQAWPGRGFWHGRLADGAPGTLTAMVEQMAGTPQPALLHHLLAGFASFTADHGGLVNGVVVAGLAISGGLLATGRRRPVRTGAVLAGVLALIAWVLVEDLGFLGGTGTDPNTMVPLVVLLATAGLTIAVEPVAAAALPPPPETAPAPAASGSAGSPSVGARVRARLLADPARTLRDVAAGAACAVVLVGAVPMAAAAVDHRPSTLVAEATDGAPEAVDSPAPPFRLVDQDGRAVDLAQWRGRTVVLTFLDPVCTSDCPIIAQELRDADSLLGADRHRVELVAVDANPFDRATADLDAFDRQEGLDRMGNWQYLTGTLAQLQAVWAHYGVYVSYEPGGNMISHSDLVEVIGPDGRIRFVLLADPSGTSDTDISSFAALVASTVRQAESGSR